MNKVKTYIHATRAPFTTASVFPVIIVALFCWLNGEFSIYHSISAVLGTLFLHLGANIINDYYDTEGSDAINSNPTPFSGGSRVVLDGLMSERELFLLALFIYILAIPPAIYLIMNGRPFVILFGLIGALLGFFYSAGPISFMTRGLGEFVIFLAFGPLLTGGAYYAISGKIVLHGFLIGIPFGFFTTAILWINEVPDREPDKKAGKWHLVVRLSDENVKRGYFILILLGFVSLISLVILGIFPLLSLISLLSLPLGVQAYRTLRSWKKLSELIPAQSKTIMNQAVFSSLIAIAFILTSLY